MTRSAPTPCTLDIAHVPMPAVIVTADGLVETVNPSAESLFTPGEAFPAAWLDSAPFKQVRQTGQAADGPVGTAPGIGPAHLHCRPTPSGVCCFIERRSSVSHTEDGFYATITEMADVGGWEIDLVHQTVYWSDAVCRIHDVPPGYRPTVEEAVAYYAPEARPIIGQAVDLAIQNGTDFDLELPINTATGRKRWVRARGRAVWEDGVCARVFGSFEDITAHRRAEQRTADSIEQSRGFERLLRTTGALTAFSNFEGQFTFVSPAWSELLGWSTEELLTRPYTDFVHPDDLEATFAEAAALTRPGHQTVHFRNRYRKKGGGWVHLSWLAISKLESERIYAVAHDISAEHETRERQERLAMIAARTTNGVLITNKQGEIEWTNASFSHMTGYRFEEMKGKRPGALLQGPETDRRTVERVRDHVRRREPFEAELRNYRKDGAPYWVAIEAQPLTDRNGEFSGYMAIENDVTERRTTRTALIAARDRAEDLAREAHAAAEAKSGFLAMMSHELRTPMNGILGTAELLDATHLGSDQRHLLETLRSAGGGLLALLNDILDYSKFESGLFEMEEQAFDLHGLLRSSCDLFRADARRRGLALRLDIAAGVPSHMEGDELRLRQVLVNLLGNAFKFTNRGSVTLSVSQPLPRRLHVRVVDTGIGIPADKQPLLFRPFTQVDASAQRRFGGTGLGLAICHRIVEMMGGDMGVESAPDSGSTFWLDIPVKAARANPNPIPDGPTWLPSEVGHRPHVLLVEDNPINTMVTTKLLEHLGCTVVHAGDGCAAVEAVDRETFDLVLMDCHMPEMDGWSATRAIRQWEQARGAPPLTIVAQTASCMPNDILRCEESGMDDVLGKPIDLTALRGVLHRWTTKAGQGLPEVVRAVG